VALNLGQQLVIATSGDFGNEIQDRPDRALLQLRTGVRNLDQSRACALLQLPEVTQDSPGFERGNRALIEEFLGGARVL